MEEGFLSEDLKLGQPQVTQQEAVAHDGSQNAARAPHVQRVVIKLESHKQLRTFEASARHPDIVRLTRVIELCQAPVDEPQLASAMIDHHVMWLDIAVHYTSRVCKLESLEQLKHVEADVAIGQARIQHAEVDVVDEFGDESARLGRGFADDVEQLDNVRSALETLKCN